MTVQKKDWIKSLYQSSWEMELLLTGFVLVMLAKADTQIDMLYAWFRFTVVDGSSFLPSLSMGIIAFLTFARKFLLFFFLFNLATRFYWIALIGLMSSPIAHKLRLPQNRTQRASFLMQIKDLPTHLKWVDSVSSICFANSILYMGYILSTVLFVLVMVLVAQFINPWNTTLASTLYITLFSGFLLFMLDNFTAGKLSGIRLGKLTTILFVNHSFFKWITGYWLYQKIAIKLRQTPAFGLSNVLFIVAVVYIIASDGVNERHYFSDSPSRTTVPDGTYGWTIVKDPESPPPWYFTHFVVEDTFVMNDYVTVHAPLTATLMHHAHQECAISEIESLPLTCFEKLVKLEINQETMEPVWLSDFLGPAHTPCGHRPHRCLRTSYRQTRADNRYHLPERPFDNQLLQRTLKKPSKMTAFIELLIWLKLGAFHPGIARSQPRYRG